MVDERFSEERFFSFGVDTNEARRLADELAVEIQAELHAVVSLKISEIIERLNSMGHSLFPDKIAPGDISYIDLRHDVKGQEQYRLRVGFDSVVSTGYAHMLSAESALELAKDANHR
jgi:hypothetical protein